MDPDDWKDIVLKDGLILQEIYQILEDEAGNEDTPEVESIFITPPDVDVLADEDSADEDVGGIIDNLSRNQLNEQPNIAQRFKANAVTTASAAASPPLEHHRNGRPTHRPKTDETTASRLIKKTGGYGTIKRVGHQTTPTAPTTNHVHNRGDGSAEAAPTVTLVLNSALQRELRGLLHSWVAHASDIFNHNANTNPDFTSDAAAIHAHPHHGFEGRITEIDISKTAASEITPQVFGYNSSPPRARPAAAAHSVRPPDAEPAAEN
ncbi:hypothetical protein GE061_009642 [Apolygus lucorum]|uniref:Uncharacterized protein n=1 Tax=Apolygus lucorum TaxID=248454 RepID=A0A8S9Y132_APOLU|nr:hypothetical protein GE061_009642 [Apolygus lucorum]